MKGFAASRLGLLHKPTGLIKHDGRSMKHDNCSIRELGQECIHEEEQDF